MNTFSLKKRSLFIICLFTYAVAGAQVFGGNPPSLKWKQINTDSVRVIFPAGMDGAAQRVANLAHYMAEKKPVPIGNDLHKINIVLQNQTTVGNGYVGLGPYRSEFFMTPILNNFSEGSISWTDQLAIHEYRHVQQYNNFRKGASRLMWRLFGEEGLAVATNAAVPDWFFEGDAVYSETVLTNQGRGRLPLFLNAYPSLWKENKKYSWMKLRNGSLKDYVPSHYHLGYLLVNYGYKKYGTDFWQKVTGDASAYKGLFYPFQKAVKRHAGIDYKQFYTDAFNYYKENAVTLATREQVTVKPVTNVNKSYVTNYLFPYRISDDSLLYLRTSYRHRPSFFIAGKDGQRKLRVKDISLDNQYSYRNGRIVYAAFEPDARWGWKDYSVIKLMDARTGKQKTITRRSKYFTPDISADGNRIAAVQVLPDGSSELHMLDAADGKVVRRISSPEVRLFTDPKFFNEESVVTPVRLNDSRMSLALAEFSTGTITRLTPASFNVTGYPSVNNDIVYFTANYEGNDDVFALKIADKKIYRITNGPLGNYYVNAAAGKITWSAFTAEGYQLNELAEKDIDWKEISPAAQEKLKPGFAVAGQESFTEILTSMTSRRKFPVSSYKKGTRLLNFHSWRPYYEDPLFSFSLYGENVLNTMQTELYYSYNENDKTSSVGFSAIYGAMFPWLSAGTEYTFNRKVPVGNRIYQWDQLDSRIGLNLPLNFTSGASFKQFNIGSNYFYRRNINKGFLRDSIGGNDGFSYLHHYFSWSQQVQRAVQHIFPKWGYGMSAAYRHAVTEFTSWQFTGNASVFLPSPVSNHSIVATAAWQEVDTLVTAFSNRFSYARGYTGRYFSRMWRTSVNYHFPIWHMDWGFANILYVQRLRGNMFYDYTRVFSRDKTQFRNQRTIGAEFFADTKWWNQYELTFGFRISRLLDQDQFNGFRGTVFEFIMPVSIIPR